MTSNQRESRSLGRYSWLALLGYAVAVAGLIVLAGTAAADLYDRYVTVRSASELLAQLEARNAVRGPSSPANPGPEGSPFLEGPTITVAGAALLQRVADAVTRAGGNVLSSQVDVNRVASKPDFVSLLVSCEVDGPSLGPLLYDIEAGMPFLFVDQVTVQAPQSIGRAEGGRLRLVLGVSGQWKGAKP